MRPFRILIIWELVPEDTHLYIYETGDDNEIELVKKAHNQFVNSANKDHVPEGVDHLSENVLPKLEKLNTDKPIEVEIDLIVISGFLL